MTAPTANAEMERIWVLLQLGRYQLAEEAIRRRLAANPTDWRAHYLLSHTLRFLGRLEEARLAATAAVGFAPESPMAHCELAQVHGQQGHFELAHEAAIESLRLDPSRADCHGYRAQLFYLRGSFNAAISCADAGLRFNARHTDCLLWRALAQEAKDQPEAADNDFRRLLHLAPNSFLLHEKIGQVLLRRYEPHQADIHLTTALRQSPEQAAKLVPLIRKARRQATWPAWFLASERQARQHQLLGIDRGIMVLVKRIMATGALVHAWWLTRQDPLFAPTPVQRWRHRLVLWLSLIIIVPVLILAGNYFGFFDASKPLTMPQMLVLLAGSGLYYLVIYLIGKKIKVNS